MKIQKQFFKDDCFPLLLALIINLCLVFLQANLLYGLLAFLIGSVLSFVCRLSYYNNKKKQETQIAKLSFLSFFFRSINDGFPVKKSYEEACRFLVGYLETRPYDEIQSSPELYDFGRYQEYFSYCLEKDKMNEAHLHNFIEVTLQAENQLRREEQNRKKKDREDQTYTLLVLLSVLFFLILFYLFPTLRDLSENLMFRTLGLFSLALLYPLCISFLSEKGGQKHA